MTLSFEQQWYLEAHVTLLTARAGGRPLPVRSGYMPNWWLPSVDEAVLASAQIQLLDAEELAPWGNAMVRLYPFVPEIWQHVRVGTELVSHAGPVRRVGAATVTRIVSAAAPVG